MLDYQRVGPQIDPFPGWKNIDNLPMEEQLMLTDIVVFKTGVTNRYIITGLVQTIVMTVLMMMMKKNHIFLNYPQRITMKLWPINVTLLQ